MIRILHGDALYKLRELDRKSVQCVVTSPPYYKLRDYQVPPTQWGSVSYCPMQGLDWVHIPDEAVALGQEASVLAYIGHMVAMFRAVWTVMRDDGVAWLNLGDSYQNKNALGIPWRVALALQADGWDVRSDIIWHKKNVKPESVQDRVTRAHEYVFMLTTSKRYYFDWEAIALPQKASSIARAKRGVSAKHKMLAGIPGQKDQAIFKARTADRNRTVPPLRRRRSVWSLSTSNNKAAHYAPMPTELAEICIKASSRVGDLVLDPFGGTGTTWKAAHDLKRDATSIELNPAFIEGQLERHGL